MTANVARLIRRFRCARCGRRPTTEEVEAMRENFGHKLTGRETLLHPSEHRPGATGIVWRCLPCVEAEKPS
jgi:hypothetical protein